MIAGWDDYIKQFLFLADKHKVRMILVGGGAVYFHGYQRHSADIDFWIDTNETNLAQLVKVFQDLDYDINEFPNQVKNQEQNISIKFTPSSLNLELITKFSVNRPFDDVFKDCELVEVLDEKVLRWRVMSFDDLITSKIKAGRPKDLLDIQELKRIRDKDL